jgi:hypothetical protein
MFVFLKKRILVDTNNESVTKALAVLEKHHIKYDVRTIRSRGVLGTAMDAGSYARSNIAMYKESSQPGFVYMVYVKRSDYLKAKHLIGTKS